MIESIDRRQFLGYLVSGSTLAVAARLTFDGLLPDEAHAQLGIPEFPNGYDLTDLLIASGTPYYYDYLIEILPENRIRFELPRMEVGQGIMTAATMMCADELDARLQDMDVSLSPAELNRRTGQITGG